MKSIRLQLLATLVAVAATFLGCGKDEPGQTDNVSKAEAASLQREQAAGEPSQTEQTTVQRIAKKMVAAIQGGTSRSWAVGTVKIHLEQPDLTLNVDAEGGKKHIVQLWSPSQNDYDVTMARLDGGPRLHEVSQEDFDALVLRGAGRAGDMRESP